MKNIQFIFKHASEKDRSLIHKWLEQDYIKQWLHSDGLETLLLSLDESFKGPSDYEHWIAYNGSTPFAYLLTSPISYNPDDRFAKAGFTPYSSAISLDLFICNKDYLGKGIAHLLIQEFLKSNFSDVEEVFIDPEASNTKAVHVYKKAGFSIVGEFIAPWHPVPHLMMHLKIKQALRKLSS